MVEKICRKGEFWAISLSSVDN